MGRISDGLPTIRAPRILNEALCGDDVVLTMEAFRLVNGVYLPMPFHLIRPLEDVRAYYRGKHVFEANQPRPVVTLQ